MVRSNNNNTQYTNIDRTIVSEKLFQQQQEQDIVYCSSTTSSSSRGQLQNCQANFLSSSIGPKSSVPLVANSAVTTNMENQSLVVGISIAAALLFAVLCCIVSYYIWWRRIGQHQWVEQLKEFTHQHDGQILLPTTTSTTTIITNNNRNNHHQHQQHKQNERVLLIVCPASGGGRAMKQFSSCSKAFQQRGAIVHVYVTKSTEDLLSLVQRTSINTTTSSSINTTSGNISRSTSNKNNSNNQNKHLLLPNSVDWKNDYDCIAILAGDSSMTELMQDTLIANNGIWPYAPLLPLPGGTANCLATEMFTPDHIKSDGWKLGHLCKGNVNAKKLTGAQIVEQYDTIRHATILQVQNVSSSSSCVNEMKSTTSSSSGFSDHNDKKNNYQSSDELEAQPTMDTLNSSNSKGDEMSQDDSTISATNINTTKPVYALHVVAGGIMAHLSEIMEKRRQSFLSSLLGHAMTVNWVVCEAALTMPWRFFGICIFNSDHDNDGIDLQFGNDSFKDQASIIHYPNADYGIFGAIPLMVKVATGWFGRNAEKPNNTTTDGTFTKSSNNEDSTQQKKEQMDEAAPTGRIKSNQENGFPNTIRLCQEGQIEQTKPYRLYADGSLKLTLDSCTSVGNKREGCHGRCRHRLQVRAIGNAIPFWTLKPNDNSTSPAGVPPPFNSNEDKLKRDVSPVSVRAINLTSSSDPNANLADDEENKEEEMPEMSLSFDESVEEDKERR